jgi:2,3-bisphosphoglycerate-dependent phosphoglycerate mutase
VERAILARHGESLLGAEGRLNGDPTVDNGLTAGGEAQGRALAGALADVDIELGVASEFPRTRATLALALAGRDVPTLVMPELNEIRFGRWEGRPFDGYLEWAWSHGPEEPCPGGGETRAEAVRRLARGFRTILERSERVILVVGHGLALRYLLDASEGSDPAPMLDQVPLAEPIPLEADAFRAALERLERWSERPVFA